MVQPHQQTVICISKFSFLGGLVLQIILRSDVISSIIVDANSWCGR